MKGRLTTILIFFILIGSLGVALDLIFGYGTFAYIHRIRVEQANLWLYELDAWGYINNVKNSFSDVAVLELTFQTRTWQDMTNVGITQTEFWVYLANNMAFMMNWGLTAINVFLYPMRAGGYSILQILALLGIDVQGNNQQTSIKWLIQVSRNLLNFRIQYI